MNADELRALQAPFKTRFRDDPTSARATLVASGSIEGAGPNCRVATQGGGVVAGLHPLTGGDGTAACSAEMLLQALAGCAGVTLHAVAIATNAPLRGGRVVAEGDLDFRGTLGVARDVPVGFDEIRLRFELDLEPDADESKVAKLVELAERYCVVFQTLKNTPRITASWTRAGQGG
ncbi:MAG: OsmC family protein [Planctomycetota bacterium]|nr:OsmC family protein [Planctomycetota bacterium]